MSETASEIWATALSAIAPKIKPHNFDLWLRPIECLEIADDFIRLRAPNRYIREWFEGNYLPIVRDVLRANTQRDYRIDFEEPPAAMPAPESVLASVVDARGAGSAAPEIVPPADVQPPILHPGLNTKYTFDTFVIGPSNQLAHAVSLAVAEYPGNRHNPLYLYGGVGLGKTHLCQAIGHHMYRRDQRARIVYVSSERFVDDFVTSLRNNRSEEFRRRYREECDILLIDDIQFIAGKDRSQIEFFHLFNVLYDSHRQIVLTSDQLPTEMVQLEERLKTRFSQGLIADIGPPDIETKIAILQRKADVDGILLPDDVAQYLASTVRSNVRELEGALSRLVAFCSIHAKRIALDTARHALSGVLRISPEHLTIETVQKVVSNYFNVKVADLRGPKRHRTITGPRQIAMYFARHLCNASFPEIGHRFGGKDHSTVITACKNVARRLESDTAYRHTVEQIERNLQA